MLLEQSYPEAALMSGGCDGVTTTIIQSLSPSRRKMSRWHGTACANDPHGVFGLQLFPRKIHERRMRTPAFLAKRVKMDAA
jgi:hypothetical protein